MSRVKFYANVILKRWQFFLSQVGIFFLFAFPIWLKTNKKFPTLEISFLCLTQDKKMPTFEINICVEFNTRRKKKSWKFFPLSRVKFYANVILKCRQFFYLESEIISFVSSQILRKRYSEMSAIFFISSWNFFPLSLVKFYANVILKHRQFFLSWVRNFFLRLDLRWRKTFPTWDKKNCRYLRITFA